MEQIKRKRLGSKAWREVLDRFATSNESMREFCRREGLSSESFRRWRIRLAVTAQPATVAVSGGKRDAVAFVDLGSLGAARSSASAQAGSPQRFELKLDLGDGMTLLLVRG